MKSFNDAASYRELAVFECGKEECVKSKAISLTKKTYHLFHYVLNGKGTLILNNHEYQISANSIFFIPRDTDAIYYADKENPWLYEWVGFDGERADDYLAHLGVSIDNPIIFDSQKDLKKHFDNLVSRYLNSGYLDISSLGCLYEIFGELLFKADADKQLSPAKVTIRLAKDFIYNNYQFDIGVNDIAKNANVTPNYLSTIFNREEKMSTKQFLTKVRMEKAMTFLTSGYFNVKDVSEMVGYPNQLHFSSEFRKYYGKSPVNYLVGGKKNEI